LFCEGLFSEAELEEGLIKDEVMLDEPMLCQSVATDFKGCKGAQMPSRQALAPSRWRNTSNSSAVFGKNTWL